MLLYAPVLLYCRNTVVIVDLERANSVRLERPVDSSRLYAFKLPYSMEYGILQLSHQIGEKGNVYLLPGTDGRGQRMLQFFTKDGNPAPNDLVQAVSWLR